VDLAAIVLARVLGFIETADLDSRGKVFNADFVQEVVKRYKFQKFPKTFEEFDEVKGVVFEDGKIGNKIIQKFTIFNTVLVLETRSHTNDSKQILEEMLVWGAAKFGLNYNPGGIKRFAYVSDLTFYSGVPLLGAACPPLVDLAAKTSAAITEIWQDPVLYYPANLAVAHDPLSRKNGVAPFTITYRAEHKFSENKYFSEAPLPTDMHIRFLEEFEAGIKHLLEQQRGNG
jgi:hypothetical protein